MRARPWLAPGRWRLGVRNGTRRRRRPGGHRRPRSVDPARDAGAFTLDRGEFRAVPSVDPGDGSMSLQVTLSDPEDAPAVTVAPSPLHRILRPFRILRVGLFGVLFRVFRAVTRRNGRRILFSSDSRAELGQPQSCTTRWSSAAWTVSTSS
jgi:hypothetical protein